MDVLEDYTLKPFKTPTSCGEIIVVS